MTDTPRLTAERFAETRHEFPEDGRWCELLAGEVQQLDPPLEEHGTTMLNLSKTVAEYLHVAEEPELCGYPCFDVGLIVSRAPDAVLFPAMSWFDEGNRFDDMDSTLIDRTPVLVAEIASSNVRRRSIGQRTEQYLAFGVQTVWILDPQEQVVHVIRGQHGAKRLASHETLLGSPVLAGFDVRVGDLFATPTWWDG
jgi:Uma2 family endonuclease